MNWLRLSNVSLIAQSRQVESCFLNPHSLSSFLGLILAPFGLFTVPSHTLSFPPLPPPPIPPPPPFFICFNLFPLDFFALAFCQVGKCGKSNVLSGGA